MVGHVPLGPTPTVVQTMNLNLSVMKIGETHSEVKDWNYLLSIHRKYKFFNNDAFFKLLSISYVFLNLGVPLVSHIIHFLFRTLLTKENIPLETFYR